MKRRALLAALAGTGGAAGTAGCLQRLRTGQGPGSEPDTTQPPGDATDSPPTSRDGDAREPDSSDPEWNPTGDPVETFRVGDRESVAFPDTNSPHDLSFWNLVDRDREIRITYVDGATEEAEILGPVTVPADHTIAIALQVPTRYALTVFVDDESFGTVVVGREWFDCNDSRTSYALGTTDIVDYGTTSTLVACPTPGVASTSVDVANRGCANDGDHDATIAYDGDRVRVDGTFVASNPCHDLAIADATYSDETRTATVVLDANAPEDVACQDCVGAIEYDATVAFENDLPDHVAVHHRNADGETERVATASRNDDA